MGKWDEFDPLYNEFRAEKKPKKIKKDRRKLKVNENERGYWDQRNKDNKRIEQFLNKRKKGKKYERVYR